MGVYIEGFEIPHSGETFRVVENDDGEMFLTHAEYNDGLYYPLIEIKEPHGRLIDADKARCTYMRSGAGYNIPIIEAETVLETEGNDED